MILSQHVASNAGVNTHRLSACWRCRPKPPDKTQNQVLRLRVFKNAFRMVKREDTASCWKSSKPAPVDKSALVRHFDEIFRFSIGMIQSIWEALSMCAHRGAAQLLLINRQGLAACFNFCHTRYDGVFPRQMV